MMTGVRAVPIITALFAIVLLSTSGATLVQETDPQSELPMDVVQLSLTRDGETTELPMSHGYWVPYMETAALDIPKGVRPGAWINMGGSYCTASFVVEDENENLYLTTAGHCTQSTGQRASILHNTPLAGAAQWDEFGTVIARWPGGWYDAALIEIDPEWYDLVDPSMPGWGGPTGVATSNPGDGYHYGWGWVTWQEHNTRCRTATTTSWGATTWWIQTETYGGGGDSGSAVMNHEGEAIGILNWARNVQYLPNNFGGAFYSDQLGGLRFDVALDALSADTGLQLNLVEGGPVTAIPETGPLDEQCHPDPPLV